MLKYRQIKLITGVSLKHRDRVWHDCYAVWNLHGCEGRLRRPNLGLTLCFHLRLGEKMEEPFAHLSQRGPRIVWRHPVATESVRTEFGAENPIVSDVGPPAM